MATNLAQLVLRHAETQPERDALIIPREWNESAITRVERLTYGELAERVAKLRAGLKSAGFVAGDRVVVLFPVSVDLYVLVLALLASGMVAVFVDTGMGKERVLQAIKLSRAKAIVSVDPLLKLWPLVTALWGLKRYSVDRARVGVRMLADLGAAPASTEAIVENAPNTSALMTFTSGSTGTPKAANRTHDILIAQHHALSEEFPETPDEIDMPCFPVVPIHNLCCGITTVMPAVDLRAPATVDAALVVDQVAEYGVTRMTGAPAYLTALVAELERRGGGLETVTRLGTGGAAAPRDMCRRLVKAMPHTELFVIYGSTEAEPMASIPMAEVCETEGDGYLVGRTAESATLEVVKLSTPPPKLDEREMAPFRVPTGEVGEIVVRGPHVLRQYVDNPAADLESKLPAPDGFVWHRTGDTGYWDEDGRLWLVGRLNDVVEDDEGTSVHPYVVEAAIDEWPEVRRSALIRDFPRRAELLLQLEPGEVGTDVVPRANEWLKARELSFIRVDVIDEIPMDPRHNSKIARPVLREMRRSTNPIPKTR